MGNPPFVTDCYYHIYNRGVEKRNIFMEEKDFHRFLETLDYYRMTPLSMRLSDFKRGKLCLGKVEVQKEIVIIHCFCLMPNHYHLLIQQVSDNGITQFLKKVSDSYTRYFNTKHKRIGPLFQGSFKAKLIETDENLLQLSRYIHRNPVALVKCEGEDKKIYPYSSYQFYLSGKKHPFCNTETILSYFSGKNPNFDYHSFVQEDGIDNPQLYDALIDPED